MMTRLSLSLLSALMLIIVAASGCVLPETEPTAEAQSSDPEAVAEPESTDGSEPVAAAAEEPAAPAPEPNMTANVSSDESRVGLCLGPGLAYLYCGTRNVLIEGTIDDLAELPVLLETFSGTVSVTTGEDNLWSLHAM